MGRPGNAAHANVSGIFTSPSRERRNIPSLVSDSRANKFGAIEVLTSEGKKGKRPVKAEGAASGGRAHRV